MATDNTSEHGWADLAREEFMLKIQAAILERCLRKEVQEKQTVEERCRILRQKISSMEDELSKAGKASAARRCLEDSSRSEFDAVDHEEFLRWLATSTRSATNTPQQEHALLPVASRKRAGEEVDGFHVFSVGPPVRSSGPSPSRTKRVRYMSKETPPCLRCRILKKKCDGSDPCSHCPTQGFDSESDFWKVLGCFRGHLRDMVDIFCPDFSRATKRRFKKPVGGIETINFVLTRSRVSLQKKQRIIHLMKTRSEFMMLLSSTWENISLRESISRSAISLDQYEMDELLIDAVLQDYEALWAVLQLVSMDRTYLTKTAYNLFSLIRFGNSCSEKDRVHWNIFFQAKRILRQSVELYLLERLCGQIASGEMIGQPPFDKTRGTPNTLIMVDLKEDVELFLRNFEKICTGRAKLAGSNQLAAFFALLVFSVAKSILTDAYVIRDSYEETSPWTADYALTISSAYKGLVSVFSWSSKFDAMLQSGGEGPVPTATLKQIQDMVCLKFWLSLGFKGTKEFLLSLGTCFLPDGSFNGFLAQKFGIETISKMPSRAGGESHTGQATAAGMEDASVVSTTREIFESLPISVQDSFVHDSGILPCPVDRAPQEQRTPSSHSVRDADTNPHHRRIESSMSLDGNNANPTSTAPAAEYSMITFVSHDSDEDQSVRRGHGGRRGALNSETLEKSREVRKLGACWNCWVLKVPCSEGFRCERCRAGFIAGSHNYRFCNRGAFNTIFMNLFFPGWLFDEYSLQSVAALTDDWVSEWVTDSTDAVISWGSEIEMTVPVSRFAPSGTGAALNLFHGRNGQSLAVESLPFALRRGTSDVHVVANSYSEKLNDLVHDSDFPSHYANHRSSELVRIVLAIVQSFYEQSQDHPLVRYCLLLCMTMRYAARPSVFTASSDQPAQVMDLMTDPGKVYTSRLLNHQTKGIFHRLAMTYTQEIFTMLEKLTRSRDRSAWPICFASMLILCVCMERLQMLAVGQTAFARSENQETIPEDEPQKTCHAMEDIPFGQLTHIFHVIYRTHKNEQHSFNPFVRGWISGDIPPFDRAAMKMVSEIKEKVFENSSILPKHNKPLNIEVTPEVFGQENSGRLVAKFLLSFITWPEKNEI